MEFLVQLKQVSKHYDGTTILDQVSLSVSAGSHLALIGPSGCGKTTVLRLIAGLEPPDAGTILVSDRTASTAGEILVPPHERGLAMLFQDLGLWPNLSVMDNVMIGLAGCGLRRPERRERAREALEACRIDALARHKPARLSGGQQQRAALARALAARPRLLMLDEPFSALDSAVKRHLYDEIRRLTTAFGVTCMVVTHDPLEATALCSDAAVLEEGRVQESGSFGHLLAHPVSQTLREFVGTLPRRSP